MLKLGEFNIKCHDVNKARDFYENVLGFEFVEIEAGHIRLKFSGHYFLLMPIEKSESASIGFDLKVSNLETMKQKLEQYNVQYEKGDYEDFNFLKISDPHGIPLEVIRGKSIV